MKRLWLVALLVLPAFLLVSEASATPTVPSQLLTRSQLSSGWSRYDIAAADTATCPESSFRAPVSSSAARVVFVERSSETLLLEKLQSVSDPVVAYAAAVANVTDCRRTDAQIDGLPAYQRINPVNLGSYLVPVRAFSIMATVGFVSVAGCVAYALKGHVVVAFGELTMGSVNARQFKRLLTRALARISA